MRSSAGVSAGRNTGYFGDVAIKGYDPVAYFTKSRAVEGSKDITAEWLGATWQFSSTEHRELFAANSIVPKELMLSTEFNIQFTSTIGEGELIARGRVVGSSEDHCLTEAVVQDGEGNELGRGTGIFVKTEIPLSSDMGYK